MRGVICETAVGARLERTAEIRNPTKEGLRGILYANGASGASGALTGALSHASRFHQFPSIPPLLSRCNVAGFGRQLRDCSRAGEKFTGSRETQDSGDYGFHQSGSCAIPAAGGGRVENVAARADNF